MPDGIHYLLSAPGRQNCVVVLADERPALHNEDYIQQVLTNFSEESLENPGKKSQIHLLLFAYNAERFSYNHDVTHVYDFLKNFKSSISLETVFEEVLDNVNKNVPTHILIIDDFSLFSLLSTNRNISKLSIFLRKALNKFQRVFVFSHKQTLNTGETALLYDVASAIAILGSFYGTSLSIQKFYVCDLLKIKNERRVSHEQSKFQVMKGEIIEARDDEHGIIQNKSQDEILKTLTTFKLTVEDNEKESRSRLYLPYFDAQKIAVEDPEELEDYDDEEDEEV